MFRTLFLSMWIASLLTLTACERRQQARPGASSEARQQTDAEGETWHASTRLRASARSLATWATIEERVRFDAAGHLVRGETWARDDAGNPEVHVVFDRPARTVVIERAGRRVEWIVPGEEPWILAPVHGPTGEPVATPLAAWVTYRATLNHEWVRLIHPLEQRSYVVPRDQYVVGTTVIVGDQAVEVDELFARSIDFGDASFARATHDGAFRFGGG